MQAKSTKQSLDRNRKALFYNHNDLDYWSPNTNCQILLTDPLVRSMYAIIKKVWFHFRLISNKLVIDFGHCWDFKVRSHRCTNNFVHSEKNSKVTGNSLKKQAGKKVRPNSRILSITTQNRFFISLHVHNVYKAMSSLLVLFFLGNLQ